MPPRKPAKKPLHKTRRPRAKNPVVEVSEVHDLVLGASVTYQREWILCGKKKCRKRHGPYWYAYWTAGGRTRTLYIGKVRRSASDVLKSKSKRAA